MLLIFKHIDFMCEMKNFPWQFGLTLSEKENSSPPSQPGGKRGGASVVLWPATL